MNAEQAYLFRHTLLRDAAYQLQLPGARAKLHSLAADLLEQLLFPTDASVAIEISEHLHYARGQVDAPDLLEREKRFTKLGAQQARDEFHHEVAIRLSRRLAEICTGALRAEAMLSAAEVCLNTGLLAQAASWIEQAQGIALEAGGAIEIQALLHRADVCVRSGKPRDAEAPARDAERLASERGLPEYRVRALALMGISMQDTGKTQSARATYKQALELARSCSDTRLVQQCTANLGALHHELGEHEAAATLYRQALAHAVARGDARLECILLTNLAALGQYGSSADVEHNYSRALEIAARIGERRQEGITLGNYAQQQHVLQRYAQAEEMYTRALAIAREVGNRRSEAIQISSLAALHQDVGRFAQALPLSLQATELLRQLGDKRALCNATGNLAALYADLGQPAKAEQTFAEAIEIARAGENLRQEGLQWCSFARFLVLQQREPEAREAWRKGAELVRRIDDLPALKNKAASLRAALDQMGLAHWAELAGL